ncbi:Fe(3+) dicitrate ABC transporter substrate-binding protein [Vibrio cincinnatiensis]|uniref:Fe(3+) dicitrate ABC transporter substrate-binding protein n=1 Tax=Vibrio cincinnatiensis TaxID=675 RepID=UPI0023DF23CA|nr:Fe(3+) dicitrate ABC transporter substrate-binding protein [Vibrio cincinnatiensis]MCG3732848.1 Fe(3+)-dicitrate ABC transporter substrate-binding protein FecB [Vibrio cincinnatiensis]MCG3739073.1 Fe(3+)-dicitrate ABC transporter substrate-binding protein FecB [Vibrio cincinnatiensis]MCG3741871.1 Fe(3+)-dicitrate ABC transporter substrate-binding protein FecB [Vibrio cincinnatiensis]
MNALLWKRLSLIVVGWGLSFMVLAVTVTDSQGSFSLDYVPQRIVALEFSFVDALVAVEVSPIGIADDNDPKRLLPAVSSQLGQWTSVGTRSQPSLEVIASLKPDLIIADVDRHAAVYADLVKIAPTLLLPSRRETYEDNLNSAQIIGQVIGRSLPMQQRLMLHRQRMQHYAAQLSDLKKQTVQFGVARENGFYAHSVESYAGGVIHALGLRAPEGLKNENASRQISLEQLLALNPDYLVVGDYTDSSIINKWQAQPLWRVLTSARKQQILHVDGNLWARCRGILAAEYMAEDLVMRVHP